MRHMDLGSILLRSAMRDPHRPMLTARDASYTYQEVLDRASRFAHGLVERGIGDGDRVVLCMRNRPEYVVALFGSALAGAVPVLANYRFSPADISHIIADTSARLAVIDETVAGHRMVETNTCGPGWVVAGDSYTPATGEWVPFDALSGSGRERLPEPVDDDMAGAIHYTSGSTSIPKGVVRSHGANAAIAFGSLERLPMERADSWALLLPMHSAGIYGVLLAAALAGNRVVLADYDATSVGDLLAAERVTHVAMGPTMYYGASSSLAAAHLGRIRHAVWGGMPQNDRATRALERVLPVPILGAFGMTEATSVTYSTPEVYRSGRIGSCGFPIASMAVRVVDSDGCDSAPGEPGEVLLHGAAVFTEYLNQPERSAQKLRDGWLHTGDGGWLDDDGALTVSGRLAGMIISGNENIWPEEIEQVIARQPGVEQVAVVGVPSERWGQEVCAYVVADRDVTENAVQEHCRRHLARYKVPKRVFRIAELPLDAQGKVQKRALVDSTPRDLITR